jgi:hypothetical protein
MTFYIFLIYFRTRRRHSSVSHQQNPSTNSVTRHAPKYHNNIILYVYYVYTASPFAGEMFTVGRLLTFTVHTHTHTHNNIYTYTHIIYVYYCVSTSVQYYYCTCIILSMNSAAGVSTRRVVCESLYYGERWWRTRIIIIIIIIIIIM